MMEISESNYEKHEAFENSMCGVNGLLSTALLVIGVAGVLGYGSHRMLGGLTLGISFSLGVVTLVSGPEIQKGKRRFGDFILDMICAVALTILGYFTFKGGISPFVLSWCIIGPTLARLAWKVLCCPCSN